MVKIVEKKRIWFIISALLVVPGLISLGLWQFRPGIDFKGGSLDEFSLDRGAESVADARDRGQETIRSIYKEEGAEALDIQVQTPDDKEIRFFVKSQPLEQEKHQNIVRRLDEATPSAIQELSFENIDPQVGADVTRKALWAVAIASLAIILYLALSFRGVPKPLSSWQFGIFAVVALLHDVIFILGFYSLMGHFFGWEVKAEFVTAALTVMGFSVHDTIVVFDRLRENLRRFPSYNFSQVANISVVQTMSRSLNTSLTVLLVLLAVVLLGGDTIRPFTLTLFVGIAVGTYSSIFVATPLLDWWQNQLKNRRPKTKSAQRFKLRFPRRRKPVTT